ncbi:MAG: hypothetical protein VB933_10045 [Pseudomonadales bacterium]
MRICFVAAFGGKCLNDNQGRLANEFANQGWSVEHIDHASLEVMDNRLTGIDPNGVRHAFDQFDRIWIVGFGDQATFLDRMQLLRTLDQSRFVNDVDALIYLHGKPHLVLGDLGQHHPQTIVSADAQTLLSIIERGGSWIGKPTAGSFGRDVFAVTKTDSNRRAIVEHLTQSGFTMLQQRIDTRDEKRFLIAGSLLIGVYGKRHIDHRSNLAAGSAPTVVQATSAELELVETCIRWLNTHGVRFATIDVAHPYLLDINIANPGWLATYQELTGCNLVDKVVQAIRQ